MAGVYPGVYGTKPVVGVPVVGWPENGIVVPVHTVYWQIPVWQAIPGEHARSQVPQ